MTRTAIYVAGLRGIPSVLGGVESHCEELLPRLAALAPDLSIHVLGRKRFIAHEPYDFRGVKVSALPAARGVGTEAITSTLLCVFHAARRGHVLHIHAIGPALLTPLARAFGLRVIVTHHGDDYNRAKWGSFAKAMLRLGERAALTWANQIIAVAPTLAERLKSRYPKRADAIHYIPNGTPELEQDRSAQQVLRDFGLEPKRFILAVGRLVPEKGFDTLINAFRRSRTDRELVIVGSDVHGSAFATMLRSQASDSVRFLGVQQRSVLRALYDQADLFVLPSTHEGLPISALEAASCGTPMLLSDIRPNRDLGLGEANYFPVGDEAALAERLRRPGGEYSYDSDAIRRSFDWQNIAEQTLKVYRQVICT